jgi:NitT/TauT family transport system ATP-binding protein
MTEKILEVRNITKSFNNSAATLRVLDGVDFDVHEGEFVSILGPSGCGKSTLLNVLSGLLEEDSGEIIVDGKTSTAKVRRNIGFGYVFQDPRLLDWSTVEDNIRFALQCRKFPKETWESRINVGLDMVGLQEFRKSYPCQLSGGMQQRVGVARALSIDPKLILMDEPFSHLDELSADRLRSELLSVWTKSKKTIVFITHDMLEAIYLSTRVLLLRSRPARIFHQETINIQYPRNPEDERIFKYYQEMLKVFHQGAFYTAEQPCSEQIKTN